MSQKTNSTDKAALLIENICVDYDKKPAIKDISLQIQKDEFYGLIGLNGAGKTTLIKTILNLRAPDSGVLRIFDQPIDSEAVKKRLVFLPERFEPSWFLSGMEFLKFSAKLYGRVIEDDECIEYAKKISLDPDALKRRVQTYSKGMRQKLGLLGTVLSGCDLMILDEPMSGLDPIARAQVKELLLDVKSKGCTIFLSSHILADMDEICDRVAILHDKKIRFTGTPADFKAQNKSETLERAFLHFIEPKAAA